MAFHLGQRAPEYWRGLDAGVGALICGRTLFDVTDGWSGRHNFDVPVVVVTHNVPTGWVEAHPDAPFHFITGRGRDKRWPRLRSWPGTASSR